MTTKRNVDLTLKDRLSRLTYRAACRLLGPDGENLIRQGGTFEITNIDTQVTLDDTLFRLDLGEAVATIELADNTRQKLKVECSDCDTLCEHAGAALSLILEEKMALGLAKPPPQRRPVENLGEKELIEQALNDRQERARTESMTVKSMNPTDVWTDYLVTNAESGKTHRVALRGWKPGESFCTCPDFRKNTLGTCKHVLHVQNKLKRRFSASMRKRPYVCKNIAVHVHYGRDLELRLLLPDEIDQKLPRSFVNFVAGPFETFTLCSHAFAS